METSIEGVRCLEISEIIRPRFSGTSRSSHRRCSVRKGVLRNFAKFTGKHLCQRLFLNKVAGLRPATLLKKSLWHRCFPVNFAKFLRIPFYRTPQGDCFSTSCLYTLRSDPHFVLWYCIQENFVSYLISNVDLCQIGIKVFYHFKLHGIIFCKTFIYLIFFFKGYVFIVSVFFKRTFDWIQGVRFY